MIVAYSTLVVVVLVLPPFHRHCQEHHAINCSQTPAHAAHSWIYPPLSYQLSAVSNFGLKILYHTIRSSLTVHYSISIVLYIELGMGMEAEQVQSLPLLRMVAAGAAPLPLRMQALTNHCHCYSYNCHGNSSSPGTNPTLVSLSQLHTDTDIIATLLDTG